MALSQNQFSMSTVVGTKVSGTNVMTVEFYSATPTDTIAAGEMVILSSTTNGQVTKVAKGSGVTGKYFGVVLTNPLKDSWAVGEKMEIALDTCVVYMTADDAITAGESLQYAYDTAKVVAVADAANTAIGIALENATADGQLVRVYIKTVPFVTHTHA